MWHFLKDLMRDGIDRALSFARTRASGDEPAAHEILHRPCQPSEPKNWSARICREKRLRRKHSANADSSPRNRRCEQKISGERTRNVEEVNQQVTRFHRLASI